LGVKSGTLKKGTLKALTGLRFFAAMHVVVFHFGQQALVDAPGAVRSLAASGYTGVSLFFVLSGFVLAYVYEEPVIDRRTFWFARFARVYPVYLAGFVLAAPYVLKTLIQSGASFGKMGALAVAALTLTQAWFPTAATVWNVPAWSLSVEAFFYLLFPFVAVRVGKAWSRSASIAAMAGLWLVGLTVPLVYLALDPDGLGRASSADDTVFWLEAVKYFPLARLPEFLLGVVLGRLFLRDLREQRTIAAGIWTVGASAALLLILSFSSRLPYPLLHNGLVAPLFAALIYGLAHGGGALGSVLSTRPLLLLGEASYAVYILHLHARPWILRGLKLVAPGLLESPALTFATYVALLVPCCLLVFLYLEAPARDWLKRTFAQSRPAATAPGR
jgi:peptidoglycan/LPS O-acetylase OafA/YrhL